MNRKLATGIVLLAILTVGGFFVFMRVMREPNSDDLERIQEGMSRDEVVSILGKPAEIEQAPDRTWLQWNTRQGNAVVTIRNDRVIGKVWLPFKSESEIESWWRRVWGG